MVSTDVDLRPIEHLTSAQSPARPVSDLGRFASISGVVVALMAVESALGLSVHGMYREETWAVAWEDAS
jgi:hypothetical protein